MSSLESNQCAEYSSLIVMGVGDCGPLPEVEDVIHGLWERAAQALWQVVAGTGSWQGRAGRGRRRVGR